MKRTAFLVRGLSLALATAVLLTACTEESPLGPSRRAAPEAKAQAQLAVPADDATLDAIATGAGNSKRTPDLGTCQNLEIQEKSKLAFHAYATGVQIYRWNGTSWAFVAPEADLFANANGTGKVGTHYAGPTWESNSGSKVVAAVEDRCTPNTNAIQWLRLKAVSAEGPGVFGRIAFILRLYTVGGLAPSAAGTTVGQEARVPYTAEYFFYRAK